MSEVQGKREGTIRKGNEPSFANELHQGKVEVEIICKEAQTSPQHQGLAREHGLLASPNYREQPIADFRRGRASREIGNESHESRPFLSGRGHIAGPKAGVPSIREASFFRYSLCGAISCETIQPGGTATSRKTETMQSRSNTTARYLCDCGIINENSERVGFLPLSRCAQQTRIRTMNMAIISG